MKSPEDRKDRLVPTRMTKQQYKQVKEKANERNMSVSAYVVEAAVHGNTQINPHIIAQIRDRMYHAADVCDSANPELAGEIRKEADELWPL